MFRNVWRARFPGWVVPVLLLAFNGSTQGAESYTWRDAEGRRYFSDRLPVDGSDHAPLEVPPLWSTGREYGEADSAAVKAKPESATVYSREASKTAKRIINAADYELSPTVLVSGRELSVRGRISGGPECGSLKLRFWLKNEHGRSVVVSSLVENAGGHFGSTIYLGTSRLTKSNYGQHWAVVGRQAVCE